MASFYGNIDVKVDEKGRVFVPFNYRRLLGFDKDAKERLLIVGRKDLERECLVFFPQEVWDEKVKNLKEGLLKKVDEIKKTDPNISFDWRKHLDAFTRAAFTLEIDPQGRILIQRDYLKAIGIDKEAVFAGEMERFTLWNRTKLEAENISDEKLAEEIGDLLDL